MRNRVPSVDRRDNARLIARFWVKVEKSDTCWLWTASLAGKGYGQFAPGGHQGTPLMAHRVAWEITNGAIPDGLFVCHRCDNPKCVRPDHLFLGSNAENMQDASRKGRIKNQNADKTHCDRGHSLSGDNVFVRWDGYRGCRTCQRLHSKNSRDRGTDA